MALILQWLDCMIDQENFTPPYCPNKDCQFHHHSTGNLNKKFWIKRGYENRKLSERVRSFQCKACKRRFCSNCFSINYRLHYRGKMNARIFRGVVHSRSNRSIARELNVSECLVRTRISRLARFGFVQHFHYLDKLKISEPIAFDGVECFARSQYEPNNINHAVGVDSLFCYTFGFAPMNRKGRMSDRQKNYLKKLEVKEGRFNPKAIRISSAEIFKDLIERTDHSSDKLVLHTDEHFQYKRAIKRDLSKSDQEKLTHKTVSSKATRNYKNILFAVNHLDLLLRQKVAAFSRETISFSKKHSCMLEKYILLICYKNYMRVKFVKRHKNNPSANSQSPAMSLGLCTKVLNFYEFFAEPNQNRAISHLEDKLPKEWKLLLDDKVIFEREHKYSKKSA